MILAGENESTARNTFPNNTSFTTNITWTWGERTWTSETKIQGLAFWFMFRIREFYEGFWRILDLVQLGKEWRNTNLYKGLRTFRTQITTSVREIFLTAPVQKNIKYNYKRNSAVRSYLCILLHSQIVILHNPPPPLFLCCQQLCIYHKMLLT